MVINYFSIKTMIGRFLSDYGLEDTAFMERVPEWTEDAIHMMGLSNYYTYKYALIKIDNHKGLLPCGLDNLHSAWVATTCEITDDIKNLRRLFIRNTPLLGKGIKTTDHTTAYGSINGRYVHTSFQDGYVYLVYKGVPLDCDGYPLVPDDAKLKEALEYYYIKRMSLSGFKHPVIDFGTAEALWKQTYPAAANSVNWMDLQDMQEFTELWTNVLLGDLHANQYIH